MSSPVISFAEGDALVDWIGLTEALVSGHQLSRANIADNFLQDGDDTLLTRSAWIKGLGLATKSLTIFPNNTHHATPTINGVFSLFSDQNGVLEATIDCHLVTKLKTASDSLLAALSLARGDSKIILIVGAGAVANSLLEAFGVGFPAARFEIWNRTAERAIKLANQFPHTTAVHNLRQAVTRADIILTATAAARPIIRGEWLRRGQHLNLIGSYRADLREADDEALQTASIYTDSLDTTISHIGEFNIPLQSGAIALNDILADFYSLDKFRRKNDDEITVFKNGGGAHLDLMTARYLLNRWEASA
ncbi:MAG: ornithine cyclodeaminase [Aestuariivita sp.]|nr:ornithine cyclodeaminase [Aestuariivita sp.]MCY4201270.1 ornithine cyclodeaminase [Aestuariivita sp.]MCY4288362.1 ornithine cyclodeaminase [Aestuariivita sp.]MCY4346392.1 ornithine cyclodeaminase [Aestuariivita sp.]